MSRSDNSCGARTPEERREILKTRQGYSLKGKIHLSKERIKEWYEAHDGLVYVAFSGGKDSTVLLDLVWSMYPDVPAVFADTGNELNSVLEFVRTYGDKVVWVKPKMSFEEVIAKWGYPILSKNICMGIDRFVKTKSYTQKKLRAFGGINPTSGKAQAPTVRQKWHYILKAVLRGELRVTNKCCGILKINPTKPYMKQTGRVPYVGTMTEESVNRLESYVKLGCNAFDSGASRPMMFWREQDVLQYIVENDLPIAGAYGDIKKDISDKYVTTGDKRTGCKFCLFGVHLEKGENRIQRLARVEPESYRHCIEDLGYDKVMDMIGVDWKPYEFKTQGDMFDERYEVEADEL